MRGAQLIGRDTEVAELRTRVTRGDSVGLFGLRKIGKTSVLRAVTDGLDPASGLRTERTGVEASTNIAVVLDVGVLITRSVDALAEELLRALMQRMQAAGEPMPPRRGQGLAAWKSAVETLLHNNRRVCVALDEYDLLFEAEDGSGAIQGLNRFFRLLRGWSQMHQGRVSLILVGRDATYLSAPEVDGVTNALLMWCTPMLLGPLRDPKASELLRKIGQRVGLKVGQESVRVALRWTGGHPLLLRQFGSALRAEVRGARADWGAPTDAVVEDALERYRARAAVLEVAREVDALLWKRYRAAHGLLLDLAEGYTWEDALTGYGGAEGEAARVLVRFGIVREDGTLPETLRWYLRHVAPTRPALLKAV